MPKKRPMPLEFTRLSSLPPRVRGIAPRLCKNATRPEISARRQPHDLFLDRSTIDMLAWRQILGSRTQRSDHLDPMLNYFLGALDVRLRRISPTIVAGSDPVKDGALEEIKQASAEFKTRF